eukprot:1128496-Amorphochlora_amoeboformis.AAC.2
MDVGSGFNFSSLFHPQLLTRVPWLTHLIPQIYVQAKQNWLQMGPKVIISCGLLYIDVKYEISPGFFSYTAEVSFGTMPIGRRHQADLAHGSRRNLCPSRVSIRYTAHESSG